MQAAVERLEVPLAATFLDGAFTSDGIHFPRPADVAAIVEARQDANSDDEHDPEGATLAFERSQSDAMIREARMRLADVDAAVARLDAGTYGRCEVCGEAIPAGRLEIRPAARRCVAHA